MTSFAIRNFAILQPFYDRVKMAIGCFLEYFQVFVLHRHKAMAIDGKMHILPSEETAYIILFMHSLFVEFDFELFLLQVFCHNPQAVSSVFPDFSVS